MAPIVISRKTGKVISAPTFTPEQRDKLWGQIIISHVSLHPELLQAQQQAEQHD